MPTSIFSDGMPHSGKPLQGGAPGLIQQRRLRGGKPVIGGEPAAADLNTEEFSTHRLYLSTKKASHYAQLVNSLLGENPKDQAAVRRWLAASECLSKKIPTWIENEDVKQARAKLGERATALLRILSELRAANSTEEAEKRLLVLEEAIATRQFGRIHPNALRKVGEAIDRTVGMVTSEALLKMRIRFRALVEKALTEKLPRLLVRATSDKITADWRAQAALVDWLNLVKRFTPEHANLEIVKRAAAHFGFSKYL